MTRKYSLVMENGPTGYSGYVPELPSILVTGGSGLKGGNARPLAPDALNPKSPIFLRAPRPRLPRGRSAPVHRSAEGRGTPAPRSTWRQVFRIFCSHPRSSASSKTPIPCGW